MTNSEIINSLFILYDRNVLTNEELTKEIEHYINEEDKTTVNCDY